MAASTTLTPEQRTERARNAARSRTSPDHLIGQLARRAEHLTDAHTARLVDLLDQAPPLSEATRSRLADLLRTGPAQPDEAA